MAERLIGMSASRVNVVQVADAAIAVFQLDVLERFPNQSDHRLKDMNVVDIFLRGNETTYYSNAYDRRPDVSVIRSIDEVALRVLDEYSIRIKNDKIRIPQDSIYLLREVLKPRVRFEGVRRFLSAAFNRIFPPDDGFSQTPLPPIH